MKRYLLFVMLCVCVSIGAWANYTVTYDETAGNTITVATGDDPDLSGSATEWGVYSYGTYERPGWNLISLEYSTFIVDGAISQTGLNFLSSKMNSQSGALDLSEASESGTWTEVPSKATSVVFAAGSDYPTKNIFHSSVNYAYSAAGADGLAKLYVKEGVTAADLTAVLDNTLINELKNGTKQIKLVGEGAEALYAELTATDGSYAIPTDNVIFSITFNGIINIENKTEGTSLQSLVEDILTSRNGAIGEITTLTVSGVLTSDDVAYIEEMTGLRTLDISGVTSVDLTNLANASVENLTLPNGTATLPNNLGTNCPKVESAIASSTTEGVTTTYVLTTVPGNFREFFNANSDKFPGGAIIRFVGGSKLNEDDFTWLSINEHNNPRGTNSYYVDMFDIDVNATMYDSKTIEDVIASGVNTMREHTNNGYPFIKGLILPKNVNTIGTTLIQDRAGDADPYPTFTEFVAYYNNTSAEGEQVTVGHVYDYNNSSSAYTANFNKMMAMLNAHSEVSGTTIYQISTNSPTEFPLTSLATSTTRIETYNNEMVKAATKATMHVYTDEADALKTAVNNTGIENTPVEKLVIEGPVSDEDLEAIASFAGASIPGPRILDLSKVTGGITVNQLNNISNSAIEYLVLPKETDKDVIFADYTSKMPNLKAVINAANSSTSQPNIVANIYAAGSLYEARCHALGLSISTDGNYYLTNNTTFGVTSVTLKGNLNAADLANQVNQNSKIGSDGHLYSDATFNVTGMPNVVASDTGNGYQPVSSAPGQGTSALNGEGSISTLDLSSAVFANQYDMNFNLLGLVNNNLQTLKLPTSSEMTILPTGALMGSSGNVIDYLCIPSNFTTIKRYALGNTTVRCLTTDNADHTAIVGANGVQYATDAEAKAACYDTFTLSSNIASVGMGAFLPQSETITDIYVMATTTPECERDAFSSGMLYGWGGFDGAGAYCREKYKNGGKLFTMLHFPEQGSMTDAAYMDMKKKYTDVNKEYTKKDQTGAVDGNGDPIAWPSQNEIYRAYNQASLGLTWNDWPVKKNPEVNTTGNGDDYSATLVPNVTADVSNGTPTGVGDYPFTNYIGWHQFVLAVATYFDQPDIVIEDEKTVLEYVEGDWYTLCLPFSLTEDQLIEMLGVPQSKGNTISRIVDKNGTVIETSVIERKLPDLRTLRGVTRTPGSTNVVNFLLTNNLTKTKDGFYQHWGINDANPDYSQYHDNANFGTNKIAIMGGYPYLVKPYLRKGESVRNLGKYLMTRFASQFNNDALSCKNIDYCSENLNGNSATAVFAKPFERHKIQAILSVEDGTGPALHNDGTKYYYAFVGQFWDQPLPRYSFYMVNNKWYRYSSGTKNYTWEAYKCIIMATQEVDDTQQHPNSGKFRNNETGHSLYPAVQGTDGKGAEIFNDKLYIEFLDGRDDSIFDSSNTNYAKYNFVFDDSIMEVDNDEVTAIMKLDGEDIQAMPQNAKVYNTAGQYVGNTTEGLSKGLYIVNGKKIVVK